MAIYLLPRATADRLAETLESVGQAQAMSLRPASELVAAIIFTAQETAEFGGEASEPLVLRIEDEASFEATLPEWSGKQRNYLKVIDPRALQKLDRPA